MMYILLAFSSAWFLLSLSLSLSLSFSHTYTHRHIHTHMNSQTQLNDVKNCGYNLVFETNGLNLPWNIVHTVKVLILKIWLFFKEYLINLFNVWRHLKVHNLFLLLFLIRLEKIQLLLALFDIFDSVDYFFNDFLP